MVSQYRIIRLIGHGGCSNVYEAEHLESGDGSGGGRRVAIKVLHANLAMSKRQVQRFMQEARAVQRICHPNMVEIYDTGNWDDGRPYMVMELIDGRTLDKLLHERGRVAPDEVLGLLRPVCEALSRAHAAGIIHRDIKASNIMVASQEGPYRVKLLDFGVAKVLFDDDQEPSVETSISRIVGTPHSMAPEQVVGPRVDSRTDVYALGALLFRLLTGRHPFTATDPQVLIQMHRTAPVPKPSELARISPLIDDVVLRAMAKNPEHRFPNAMAFLDALSRVLEMEALEEVRALAICVQAYPAEGCLDDLDDELMDILDTAQEVLSREHFAISLSTSNMLLAVIPAAERYVEMRKWAIEVALALHGTLSRRVDERLHTTICVHSDMARVRTGETGWQLQGGAVTDVSTWPPRQTGMDGVYVTRGAMGPDAAAYVRLDTRDKWRIDEE